MITVEQAKEVFSSRGPSIGGTAKKWFKDHHGKVVDTAQSVNGSIWTPRGRVINSIPGTYVLLDGSRRDYAGLKVLHALDDSLLVSDGPNTWILYQIV